MLLPMLAQTFDNHKHLVYPLFVQPKIDGIRCIVYYKNSDIVMISRTGHILLSSYLYPIKRALQSLFDKYPDIVLDGELYSEVIPFETLSGLCRLNDNHEIVTDTKGIFYYCFDIVDTRKSFQERSLFILSITELLSDNFFRIVETIIVKDGDEMMQKLHSFEQQNYEGIILRNMNGMYTPGRRSYDLQKLKKFIEQEFEIVGFYEAKGKDKGSIIWECQTLDKHKFRVRPKGDYEYRKNLLQNAEQYIGKPLTIIFQEYTRKGIPRFPVAKAVRENY